MVLFVYSPLMIGNGMTMDEQFRAVATATSRYSMLFFFMLPFAPLLIYNLITLSSLSSDWGPAYYASVISLLSLYLVGASVAYMSQALLFPRMLAGGSGFENLLFWYIGNRGGLAWFLHELSYLALAIAVILLFSKGVAGIPLFAAIRGSILLAAIMCVLSFIGGIFDLPLFQSCILAGFAAIVLYLVLQIVSAGLSQAKNIKGRTEKEVQLDDALLQDARSMREVQEEAGTIVREAESETKPKRPISKKVTVQKMSSVEKKVTTAHKRNSTNADTIKKKPKTAKISDS